MKDEDGRTICERCGAWYRGSVAVFKCPSCNTEICDACKTDHQCGESKFHLASVELVSSLYVENER